MTQRRKACCTKARILSQYFQPIQPKWSLARGVQRCLSSTNHPLSFLDKSVQSGNFGPGVPRGFPPFADEIVTNRMQALLQKLIQLFVLYGYWTVFFGVMLENAGLPVPGETVLLVASFLAANSDAVDLKIQWIILIAIGGATLGDNLGYWIGRRGGRPFLDRHARRFFIHKHHIERAERVFQRYGAWTVFFARFITGLRVVAGPFAGVLHLPWPRFLIFNFAGAVVWSTAISLVGYFFGSEWPVLLKIIKRSQLVVLGIFLFLVAVLYWRTRAKRKSKSSTQ